MREWAERGAMTRGMLGGREASGAARAEQVTARHVLHGAGQARRVEEGERGSARPLEREPSTAHEKKESMTLTCSDLDQTEAEYRPVQTVITLIMVGSRSDQGRNMVWKSPRCRRR